MGECEWPWIFFYYISKVYEQEVIKLSLLSRVSVRMLLHRTNDWVVQNLTTILASWLPPVGGPAALIPPSAGRFISALMPFKGKREDCYLSSCFDWLHELTNSLLQERLSRNGSEMKKPVPWTGKRCRGIPRRLWDAGLFWCGAWQTLEVLNMANQRKGKAVSYA